MGKNKSYLSYHIDRTKRRINREETILAIAWAERCKSDPKFLKLFKKSGELTRTEARCCAGVFQWLGTPIGSIFLVNTLRKAGYLITEPKSKNHKLLKYLSQAYVLILLILEKQDFHTVKDIQRKIPKYSCTELTKTLNLMLDSGLVDKVKAKRCNLWAATDLGVGYLTNYPYLNVDSNTYHQKQQLQILEL